VDPNDEEEKANLIISLMTVDSHKLRMKSGGKYTEVPKKFCVYKVKNVDDAKRYDAGKVRFYSHQLSREPNQMQYEMTREVTGRFRLTPGYYVIIPSTYDMNVKLKFLLRLSTETELLDAKSLDNFNPEPKNVDDDSDENYDPNIDQMRDRNGEVIPASDWIDKRSYWPDDSGDDDVKHDSDQSNAGHDSEWPDEYPEVPEPDDSEWPDDFSKTVNSDNYYDACDDDYEYQGHTDYSNNNTEHHSFKQRSYNNSRAKTKTRKPTKAEKVKQFTDLTEKISEKYADNATLIHQNANIWNAMYRRLDA